ncbi:AAA family ATPase [Consotaella aegiceratis]|uniref:bifunctional aminoglycoside phosphotransferase/ATP-binding protein n=1 Tax=Consotaella aegiceratis TaxID=3097961 RepID=UPI002F40BA0E
MAITDEDEIIAFLASDEGFGPSKPEIVRTHISVVLLTDDRAIKLKRAVTLPYADFSTPQRRLEACRDELRLNRRTAPELYRDVHRVTRRPDGGLMLDGDGDLVDAVVEMERFEADQLFDAMVVHGELTPDLMTRLAARIATFHDLAAVDSDRDGAGRMAAVLDVNERGLNLTDVFDEDEVEHFNAFFRAMLDQHAGLLDERAAAGHVRHCHGDLHLRNICLFRGEPTLFDCLEFNPELATTDVLYDLAFLLMDLWHRDMRGLANLVFNRYLDDADEEDGLALLSFFMATRAAVRAHVTAAQCRDAKDADADRLAAEARSYFDLAKRLLEPREPVLLAVGGLSGSGKSTVAAALAPDVGPPPGARVLSSDRLRKRLFGVSPQTHLPAEAYLPEVSRKVYARLALGAGQVVRSGMAAIADAVFERPADRRRIAQAAEREHRPFCGLWLQASLDVMKQRVADRGNDISDATGAIVEGQVRRLGVVEWPHVDASGEIGSVCAAALRTVGRKSGV